MQDRNDSEVLAWTNQDLVLYHGTDEAAAASITANGVSLRFSRAFLDFGRGFYMTTSREQAAQWARQRSRLPNSTPPTLMRAAINRNALAGLDALSFVRGSYDAPDFWSFVDYCRRGGDAHGRPGWYDIVSGPVSLVTFPRRRIRRNSDQLSFHTAKALTILNKLKLSFESLSW